MEYERRIHVDRPPAELFAYLCDERHVLEWREGLLAIRRLDPGPPGASHRRYAETLRTPLGPHTVAVALTRDATAWELRFEVLDGPVRPRGEIRLRLASGGTEVAYRLLYTPRLPIVTPIDKAIFAGLTTNVERSLARLEAAFARTASPPPGTRNA